MNSALYFIRVAYVARLNAHSTVQYIYYKSEPYVVLCTRYVPLLCFGGMNCEAMLLPPPSAYYLLGPA